MIKGARIVAFKEREDLQHSIYTIEKQCCGIMEDVTHRHFRARLRAADMNGKPIRCRSCHMAALDRPEKIAVNNRAYNAEREQEKALAEAWEWAKRIWFDSLRDSEVVG
jgi:hypothetical protein